MVYAKPGIGHHNRQKLLFFVGFIYRGAEYDRNGGLYTMEIADLLLGGAGLALVGAFALVAFLLLIVTWIVYSLALMTIGKKLKVGKPAWMAWVPVFNAYYLLKCVGLPGKWLWAFFLVLIPVVGPLLLAVGAVYVHWKLFEARHYPPWLSILMLLSFVNIIVFAIVAWRDNK